jgi:hypothetical protein
MTQPTEQPRAESVPTLNANDLVSYPNTVDEVTADRLIRLFTIDTVLMHQRQSALIRSTDFADPAQVQELAHYSVRFVACWTETALLRELRALDPDRADAMAKQLWAHWENGESMYDLMTDWLRAEGIDPVAYIEPPSKKTPAVAGC